MNMTSEMERVPVEKLIPYINNARTHSPEQIKKLRASLREFGFVNPVIIDRDYNVIAGHGRIMAAKEEGITEVPCVYADHLTEAQKKAYILADNRMALDAGWDEEMLRVEIEALQEMDYDNNGALEQYFIRDNHKGIIPREEWEAVQVEMKRREEFRQRHGISTGDRFYSRVFCATCGGKFVRKYWKGNRAVFWKCENAEKRKGHTCSAEFVREETLRAGMVVAWNSIVEHREEHLPAWERMATEGDALQRYRARMFLAMTAEGPLDTEVPELTRSVLEEIIVQSPTELVIRFLDGTEKQVKI